MIWPLLMDAIHARSVQVDRVQCLLSLEADPNYRVPCLKDQSPWDRLLRLNVIEASHSAPIKTSSLSDEARLIVEGMVMHDASVARARYLFGSFTFKNRYGTQEVIPSPRKFSDEFFRS